MNIGPKITFFLNIYTLLKNYWIDIFCSFSNLGLGIIQHKNQRAKQLKLFKLRFKTLKIGRFCTLNEKWLVPGTLLASKELRRKTLIA